MFTHFTDWFPLITTVLATFLLGWLSVKMYRVRILRVPMYFSWGVLVISALIGNFFIFHAGEAMKRNQEEKLSSLAKVMASSLQEIGHAEVTFLTPQDDPHFRRVIDRMYDWMRQVPTIACIYTLRQAENGDLIFVMDPAADFDRSGEIDQDDEQELPAGTFYDSNDQMSNFPEFIDAFDGKTGFNDVPSGDIYGYWITAAEPIFDENGNVEAIIGVDFWADEWIWEHNQAKLWPILFFFSFLVIFFSAQFFLIRRQATEAKIADYAIDLERALEELVEAKREADTATQAKGYFLANMSHEIRTPMNAILGCAEMLDSGSGTKDGKISQDKIIEIIRKSGKDLMTIIDDILTFSSLDSKRIMLESAPASPKKLLEEVGEMIRGRLEDKPDVQFSIDYIEPIPETILCDQTRLRQILLNLIGNAVKFTEKGRVEVHCSVQSELNPRGQGTATGDDHSQVVSKLASTGFLQSYREDNFGSRMGFVSQYDSQSGAGAFLRFEITDSGIGMTQEQLKKLFKPFSQVDSSSTRKYGGTGLGLGIARGLARLMGGNIFVITEPNKGSTFTLLLPLRIPGEPGTTERKTGESSQRRSTMLGTGLGTGLHTGPFKSGAETGAFETGIISRDASLPLFGFHVLVVDDGVVNQLVAETKLRDAGAEVEIASDGHMALEKVEAAEKIGYPFNAILMDMQMPIMDGFEATRKLRERGFTRPILAISANFDADKDAREAGCDLSLLKPFNRDELIETILRLTGASK